MNRVDDLRMHNVWTELHERTELSLLGDHLSRTLPDDFVWVAGPIVHGRELDAVVVGRRGLFVLHARDWEGSIRPAQRGAWVAELESGERLQLRHPARDIGRAGKDVAAFLRDEFPGISPDVRHVVVLTDPQATLSAGAQSTPTVAPIAAIAQLIVALEDECSADPLDAETQSLLASGLAEGRFTSSQRASQPFMFRTGGLFGTGRKAWTIRAVVSHFDRRPEDGVHHLRNGTLARWLLEQGAPSLAELARAVMQKHVGDPYAAVEAFLIGSGLVVRPRLSVRPDRVDLGNVLSGDTCGFPLRVSRAGKHHYLRCTVKTRDPWLGVEPSILSGQTMQTLVVARTDALHINRAPYETSISVQSSVSDEAVEVPIRLRVVGKLSPLNRYIARPLAGALVGGLMGAGVGAALGQCGIPAPSWFAIPALGSTTPSVAFAILVGLFWAALGATLGYAQPVTWPTPHALGRWVRRVAVWGATLSLVAGAGLWFSKQLSDQFGLALSSPPLSAAILSALAAAMLPAAVHEIQTGRREREGPIDSSVRMQLRPLVAGFACAALMVLLVAGGRVLEPVLDPLDVQDSALLSGGWVSQQWEQFEGSVNGLLDQLLIRYYDTRAPSAPTPTIPARSGTD